MGRKRELIDSNEQQPRRLLPAKPGQSQTESKNTLPPNSRGRPIKSACLACQKRKVKCSGERPTCAKCASRAARCLYDTDMSDETHAQALKRKYDELQVTNTAYKEIYEFLQSTSKANAEEVISQIRSGIDAETMGCRIRESNLLLQAVMLNKEPVNMPCFQELLSWKLCRASSSDDRLPDEDESTILTLPPRPLDAYKSSSQEDTWTQVGWTKAHIRHLIDAVFTWDYLPFSLLCHDLFLKSFYSDSTRFCSAALVYAFLALASRVVNEDKDDLEILPSGWVGSKIFLDKAKERLQQNSLKTLPDIQAIGILSLYHLRCGQEESAHECAKAFVTSITELYEHDSLAGRNEDQYARTLDVTYSGAVSLSRILLLTTGQLFDMRYPRSEAHVSILDRLSSMMETSDGRVSAGLGLRTGGNGLQLYGLHFISAKIFQLTEWVYELIMSAHLNSRSTSTVVREFYDKCLDWYGGIFAYAEKDCGRTPFVLFAHMYYHFSILCAFRRVISLDIVDSDIRPHRICKEAAQSILALVQSYDDLFTLRRVSGLIPYFVCSSGLLSLAMEARGTCMNEVYLRLKHNPPGNKARIDQNVSSINYNNPPATSTYITMSATEHARQLLTKMGSTHPAAKVAASLL